MGSHITENLEFPDENRPSGPSHLAQQSERVSQPFAFSFHSGGNPYPAAHNALTHNVSSGIPPGWHHPPNISFSQPHALQTTPSIPAAPTSIGHQSQQLHYPQQIYPLPQGYYYPPPPGVQDPGYYGALQDNTHLFVNDASAARAKRKTGGSSGATNNRKRRREIVVPTGPPSVAAVCGVGPSESTFISGPTSSNSLPTSHPSETTLSDLPTVPPETAYAPRKNRSSAANATDCWYFVRALEKNEEPEAWPTNEPILSKKPSTPYIGCKLCTHKWHVWRNGDGMTSSIRLHLKKFHNDIYAGTCKIENLKHSSKLNSSGGQATDEEFRMERFHELLMRWVVADDQSINVVENPEFRELLAYLGDNVSEEDIPHRTQMKDLIFAEYNKVYENMTHELQHALGRVSTTMDLWSDPSHLYGFMGVTAHYMARDNAGRLELKACLLAFRHIAGSHAGEHTAKVFYDMLKAAGILKKLGQSTMDNAGTNNTHMDYFEHLLEADNIQYDADGNRIRCFPHVINIATQRVMEELDENPIDPVLHSSSDPARATELQKYATILETRPIRRCRELVAACRASGQRREDLKQAIVDGNKSGDWKIDGKSIQLPELQLLRDCETRWSSTFNMLGRILDLYLAIEFFIRRPRNMEMVSHLHSPESIAVVGDIHQIFGIPNAAQELLCSERTPTLSMALPVYESLLVAWEAMKTRIPELSHYISVGLAKLQEYIHKSRSTRVYALAMILNPSMKFEWMTTHWNADEVSQAREWMLEAMATYHQHIRLEKAACSRQSGSSTLPRTASLSDLRTTRAATNQSKGLDRLRDLATAHRRSSSLANLLSTSGLSRSGTPSLDSTPAPPDPPLTEEEKAELERQDTINDRKEAERELHRYEEEGVISECHRSIDLVRYWDNKELDFKLLFHVAMDILPAQASSVPCERIFSSSKDTCTPRRNRLSPAFIEVLQMLKFNYRQDRLDFTSDFIAEERDYSLEGEVTQRAIRELMEAGKYEELKDLFKNSENKP